MQNFISAVLGALIVGAVFLLFASGESQALSETAATDELLAAPFLDSETQRSIGDLRDRVRQLEASRVQVVKQSVERRRVETIVPHDLRERLRKLANEIGDLRKRLSLITIEPQPMRDTKKAQNVIRNLIFSTRQRHPRYIQAMSSIPLRVQFLEQWPRHKVAHSMLLELIGDFRTSEQLHKAVAAVERFGPRMGLESLDLDVLRLRAAYTDRRQIEISRRIVSSPATPYRRVWAMNKLSRSLVRTGQQIAALQMIDALLSELANSHAGRAQIGDARSIRSWILKAR